MYQKPVRELHKSFITSSQFPAKLLILTVVLKRAFQIFCIKALKLHSFACKLSMFVVLSLMLFRLQNLKISMNMHHFPRKESQKFFAIMLLFDRGKIVVLK